MTTIEASPEAVEAGVAMLRDEVFPGVREMEGFRGMIAFGDRTTGKMMAITLWETEDAMKASEEGANHLRAATSDATSARIASVERLEVIFDERL
jgi:heme-degrading monooxygenase HmoA